MADNLTIGTLYQNKRTGQKFELTGIKGIRVQLATVNGEAGDYKIMTGEAGDYKIMTQKSLRANYTLVAMKATPEVIAQIQPDKPIVVKDVTPRTNKSPGRIEMPDGRVILGLHFLRDIVCDLEAVKAGQRSQSIIYWLSNIAAGKEILAKFDAQIVYGKELTK